MAKFADAADARRLSEDDFFEEARVNGTYVGITYGSAAPALEPYSVPLPAEPEQKPEQKPEHKPSHRPRVSRAERRGRMLLMTMILSIAVGALLIVGMYARNFVRKNQLAVLNGELEAAVTQTQTAGTEETKLLTLSEIRDYAVNELGMRTAGAGEVITLTVSFGAYTEDYTVPEGEERTVGFHWFGN